MIVILAFTISPRILVSAKTQRYSGIWSFTDAINSNPLSYLSSSSHFFQYRVLVAKGLNLNSVNINGEAPLHLAAWKGTFEIAQRLVIPIYISILTVNFINHINRIIRLITSLTRRLRTRPILTFKIARRKLL